MSDCTRDEFIAEKDSVLRFDPRHEGYCPCASIICCDAIVEVRCWRTTSCGFGCEYSCVHAFGLSDESALKELADHAAKANFWNDSTEYATSGVVVSQDEFDRKLNRILGRRGED